MLLTGKGVVNPFFDSVEKNFTKGGAARRPQIEFCRVRTGQTICLPGKKLVGEGIASASPISCELGFEQGVPRIQGPHLDLPIRM